jgi:hypothetical protein
LVPVIRRSIDIQNLVRELADNKVDALELIREGISNAKDHGANGVWIRTSRSRGDQDPSILFVDNGEGMDEKRLAAFWGVGASNKGKRSNAIGYKGHGSKLFFACHRLSVATRTKDHEGWYICAADSPKLLIDNAEISVQALDPSHPIHDELARIGLLNGTGSVIFAERIVFKDAERLLQRRRIESYCDWFTAIGDIRSGLFDERLAFHRLVAEGDAILSDLHTEICELRPIRVDLRINGEKGYTPLGLGPTAQDREMYSAWSKDRASYEEQPEIFAFGHRFADVHESAASAGRARDDTTVIRLTGPQDWSKEEGYAIVARVEGHRRQRDTYVEAGKSRLYTFEGRFGMWLCRDFIPIVHRNDLLQEALNRASKTRLQFELNNLRNWQVFVNSQSFLPTANRGSISNQDEHDRKIVDTLVVLLEAALKKPTFREWVARLRAAKLSGLRDREVAAMDERRDALKTWISDKKRKEAIDPAAVTALPALGSRESLLMRAPTSEQELFYVYGLLSGRYRMPLHVLEYDASRGVDAIALLRDEMLVRPKTTHVRVEFKYAVSAGMPIDHFFQAIDIIVCWKVDRTGPIYEQSSDGDGELQERIPILDSKLDTFEIVYTEGSSRRVIPILEIANLFAAPTPEKKSKR